MKNRNRKSVASITLLSALLATCLSFPVIAEIQIDDIIIDGPPSRPATGITVPAPKDSATSGNNGEAPRESVLEFLNNDKIHGKLLGASSEEFGLKWKHSDVRDPIDFAMSGVSRILLGGRKTTGKTPHNAVVMMTNDDIIRGRIVSLDEKGLIIDTWYAGKLTIARPMIKRISPSTSSSFIIYEGPTGLSGWTMSRSSGRKAWSFEKGSLYAIQSYPIGRYIEKMPDVADIEFTMAWRGYPQFYFSFYTDTVNQYYGNCYMLQASSSSVYLQRYTRNGSQKNLGSVNIPEFSSGKSTHATFNILVNKKKKSIVLMINGKVVKQWQDTGDFAGKGNGILFQPQSQGNLKIKNIKVSKWDGRIPQAVESSEDKVSEDTITLSNNDRVTGTIVSIKDDTAAFKTSYATLSIPVKRIVELGMATDKGERARRNKNDVRAHFPDRGNVTLQLSGIKNGQITGESENFGKITMPVSAFKILEFNIYDERKKMDDDDYVF